MPTLKNLTDKYQDVWVLCENEHLQQLFLKQAEEEGFVALNGQTPTELYHQKFYGISDDMSMGYLSSMIWSLTKKPDDKHVRIDYSKLLDNDEPFLLL